MVIPAKNDAAMLERCLASLATQTVTPVEVVVVDNASTDATAEVARSWGARVIGESRPGITAAASTGYDAAVGDIIARCDADSRLDADWLERIQDTFDRRPEVIAVTGRGEFYDLGPVANWFADVFYMRAYFLMAGGATANTPLFGSNFAMRRETWAAVSPSVPRDNPALHDDFDLTFRLDPAASVLYDSHLVVGISGRPFSSGRAMRRRFAMAAATIGEHLPESAPPIRWYLRLTGRSRVSSGWTRSMSSAPGAPRSGSARLERQRRLVIDRQGQNRHPDQFARLDGSLQGAQLSGDVGFGTVSHQVDRGHKVELAGPDEFEMQVGHAVDLGVVQQDRAGARADRRSGFRSDEVLPVAADQHDSDESEKHPDQQ